MAEQTLTRRWIAIWGVLGVVLVCAQAIFRLTPLALEPWIDHQMAGWQMAVYIGWICFNVYAEGYRGFQKAFAPRVVVRAFHLAREPRPLYVIFAPLYTMALIHASRRRLIVSWGLLVGIVAIVIAVRQLPQPYRGMVDGGVVIGLAYGTIAIVVFFVNALRGKMPGTDPGLP